MTISLQFARSGIIDNNSSLLLVLVLRHIGDKPLPEAIATQFTDAIFYGIRSSQILAIGPCALLHQLWDPGKGNNLGDTLPHVEIIISLTNPSYYGTAWIPKPKQRQDMTVRHNITSRKKTCSVHVHLTQKSYRWLERLWSIPKLSLLPYYHTAQPMISFLSVGEREDIPTENELTTQYHYNTTQSNIWPLLISWSFSIYNDRFEINHGNEYHWTILGVL